MKKLIILCLTLSLILQGCDKKTSDQFTFAFITDIHLKPELNAVEGFKLAIDTINQINPDFVITGGDLIMDALNQTYGRADSLYDLYILESGAFNMPIYNTMGNHEIFGWNSDDEEIQNHAEYGKKMFENRIGKRYYSFDHKGWHFIILDAISKDTNGGYWGKLDNEQIEWLKMDLQKLDKETPIAVSTHIPFISARTQLQSGSMAINSKGSVITNSREVLLHFQDYNLKLVLQGHLHFLEDIYFGDKVHFITAGAVSGRWWQNKPDSEPEEGFLIVRVTGDEIKSEYVDYGWTPELE
jgi:3',5'-cyclic-AMP phosphodiesterase